MHNYISSIHEDIKSRLLFCSEVHFVEMLLNVSGWGNTPTQTVTTIDQSARGSPADMVEKLEVLHFWNVKTVLES